MKKISALLVVVVLFFGATSAMGKTASRRGDLSYDSGRPEIRQASFFDWVGEAEGPDIVGGIGGAIASILDHERAHFEASVEADIPSRFSARPSDILLGRSYKPQLKLKYYSSSKRLAVTRAGFVEQASSTDKVMLFGDRSSFSAVYVLTSAVNELAYSTLHFSSGGGYGDFKGISGAGGDGDAFALVVLVSGLRHLYALGSGNDPFQNVWGKVSIRVGLDKETGGIFVGCAVPLPRM